MFTPQQLEKIPIELEKIFNKLEQDIMLDIIRRIATNGEITRTADYQLNRLYQLGVSKKVIKKYIQEALELSKKEINSIYRNAIKSGYTEDEMLYKAVGKSFIEFEDNDELQQLIRTVKEQTNNDLYNITQSTGFMTKEGFKPVAKYYQDTLDKSVMSILNGSFDYNTVIRNTVQEMTKSGLRTIDYKSGRSYRIDTAVRTALMTGVNQVTSKISDENGKKLETNYFEVSAHGTARPSHQKWQGKVYTREELENICGLGEVDGLCGANCRHHYFPFIPGISVRNYTDEQLEEWAKRENTPRKYGDKEYTLYEASQEQRKLERLMRKQRQDIKLLKEGNANEEDIITAQARYRITSDEYVKFSKAMGLPEQRARVYQDGLTGNYAGGEEVQIKANELKNESNRNIISKKIEKEENDVHYIGKIDKNKFSLISKDITTDEVILTDKQVEHIKERHPNDYERYFKYFKKIIENPDYIIKDKKPNTGFLLKEFTEDDKRFQLILRLHTSKDEKEYKNSIITFLKVSEKKYNQYLRNKEIVWKKVDKNE